MLRRLAPMVVLLTAIVLSVEDSAHGAPLRELGAQPASIRSVGIGYGFDLTARQEQAVFAYMDATSRSSIADVCANQRLFYAKLRTVLTPQQLRRFNTWKATRARHGTATRDRLAAQKSARLQESTYNALVSSEAACRETKASCAAAAHAVSVAAAGLQSALINELVSTRCN
jgi:Spy/CpxP family protein refolding chaperone